MDGAMLGCMQIPSITAVGSVATEKLTYTKNKVSGP